MLSRGCLWAREISASDCDGDQILRVLLREGRCSRSSSGKEFACRGRPHSEWGHTTLRMRTTSLPARLASRGGLPLAPSRGDCTSSGSFATKERDALPVIAFDHSVGEWPPGGSYHGGRLHACAANVRVHAAAVGSIAAAVSIIAATVGIFSILSLITCIFAPPLAPLFGVMEGITTRCFISRGI